MTTRCNGCGVEIDSDESRFYVAFSDTETYRENWVICFTVCVQCLFGGIVRNLARNSQSAASAETHNAAG